MTEYVGKPKRPFQSIAFLTYIHSLEMLGIFRFLPIFRLIFLRFFFSLEMPCCFCSFKFYFDWVKPLDTGGFGNLKGWRFKDLKTKDTHAFKRIDAKRSIIDCVCKQSRFPSSNACVHIHTYFGKWHRLAPRSNNLFNESIFPWVVRWLFWLEVISCEVCNFSLIALSFPFACTDSFAGTFLLSDRDPAAIVTLDSATSWSIRWKNVTKMPSPREMIPRQRFPRIWHCVLAQNIMNHLRRWVARNYPEPRQFHTLLQQSKCN